MMKVLAALVALLLTAGCAVQGGARIDQQTIAIDKVSSGMARIGAVTLRRSAAGLQIDGSVIRRYAGRGPIEGYVRIEALGADGRVLSAIDTGYRRTSIQGRTAAFSTLLDIDPARVKRVRVIHDIHDHPSPPQ